MESKNNIDLIIENNLAQNNAENINKKNIMKNIFIVQKHARRGVFQNE